MEMTPSRTGWRTLLTLPLVVLTAIYFMDEFDTAAFGVLAPDIQHSFHLSDSTFGLLVIGNVSPLLLCGIPLSHYADRLPQSGVAAQCCFARCLTYRGRPCPSGFMRRSFAQSDAKLSSRATTPHLV